MVSNQIYGVQITGKYICQSKNWIFSFTRASKQNSPQVFIINLTQNEIIHSCWTTFSENLFFPQQKGVGLGIGDYGVETITKIKPGRVLVTSFDKFHYLCKLNIFGSSFAVSWFSFKHAEVFYNRQE